MKVLVWKVEFAEKARSIDVVFDTVYVVAGSAVAAVESGERLAIGLVPTAIITSVALHCEAFAPEAD